MLRCWQRLFTGSPVLLARINLTLSNVKTRIPGSKNTRIPLQVVNLNTFHMRDVCVRGAVMASKTRRASIVHCFLCVTAAELPTWHRVAAAGVYPDTPITHSERQPLPWSPEKKGIDHFFFFFFFGLPGSAAACGPEGASGFTRRPASLGPRRPSAQARPSGGQDGEGRGARENRMKGNPHCERASGVRVLHVWWSSS